MQISAAEGWCGGGAAAVWLGCGWDVWQWCGDPFFRTPAHLHTVPLYYSPPDTSAHSGYAVPISIAKRAQCESQFPRRLRLRGAVAVVGTDAGRDLGRPMMLIILVVFRREDSVSVTMTRI